MRVLLIEDNELVSELVRAGFESVGWSVDSTSSGQEGLELLRSGQYDAVVLDIELPDTDGLKVLSAIRGRPKFTPVVMLTAKSGPENVVRGLVSGADDYVTKPFDMGELIARVLAVLRRTGSQQHEILQLGDITFNRLTRETNCNGRRIRLTPKEQTFLEQLLLTPGKAVSREDLLENVWRINFDPGSNLVDTHVARLRSKLKGANAGISIVTRRGEGFAVELAPADGASPATADKNVDAR